MSSTPSPRHPLLQPSEGKMGACCFIQQTKPRWCFWNYSTNKNTALGDQPPHSPPAPTADDESKLPPPTAGRRRSSASSPYTRSIDVGSAYGVGVAGIIAAAADPPQRRRRQRRRRSRWTMATTTRRAGGGGVVGVGEEAVLPGVGGVVRHESCRRSPPGRTRRGGGERACRRTSLRWSDGY